MKCGPLTFQWACFACSPRSSTSASSWFNKSTIARRVFSRRSFLVSCSFIFIKKIPSHELFVTVWRPKVMFDFTLSLQPVIQFMTLPPPPGFEELVSTFANEVRNAFENLLQKLPTETSSPPEMELPFVGAALL